MYGEINNINLCVNEKERNIVRKLDKLTEEDFLFWQDVDEQIPILIIAFIGSSIFRQHYIFQAMIIGYVAYGYRIKYCHWYYMNVIYPRLKGKYDK